MVFKTGICVELIATEINVRLCSMQSVRLVIETKKINEKIKEIFILITSKKSAKKLSNKTRNKMILKMKLNIKNYY